MAQKTISLERRFRARNEESTEEITNQSKYLLSKFILDRMLRDGVINVPKMDDLLEPYVSYDPPLEDLKTVVRALQAMGDQLDNDYKIRNLASKVRPDSSRKVFMRVANNIFNDGVFGWGRVVALFYFGYQLCVKALNKLELMRSIIGHILIIIRDRVARWILRKGGWTAIQEIIEEPFKWWKVALMSCATATLLVASYYTYSVVLTGQKLFVY